MINGTNPVVWLGDSYQPLPVKMSGFDQNSNGRLPRPKFAILNIEGTLSKIVHSNNDFVGCKVTRKRTFVRFLDSVNFQGGVNPFGDSNENMALPDEVYYINKKNTEKLIQVYKTERGRKIHINCYCDSLNDVDIDCSYYISQSELEFYKNNNSIFEIIICIYLYVELLLYLY